MAQSQLTHFYNAESLLLLGLKLALVIALIYGSAYLLKRYGQLPLQKNSPHQDIVLLHRQRLSPQAYLQLVEVENERLLIAVQSDRVTLLKTYKIHEEHRS